MVLWDEVEEYFKRRQDEKQTRKFQTVVIYHEGVHEVELGASAVSEILNFLRIFLFLKSISFSYFQRERKGERETSISCLSRGPKARNPGMCPDWESNQQPFGLQASAQSTEPHQPGLLRIFFFFFPPQNIFKHTHTYIHK